MKKSTNKNFSLIGFLLVGITIAAGLWEPGVGVGNAAAPEAPQVGCATVTSGGGWQNFAISPQTGAFTAEFDATPSASLIDSVVGLSRGAQTAYTGFATLARFNPSGNIDARNGGAYAAASTIPYSANVTYHFRLVVNVPARTYSIFVTPAGGTEQTVGTNFAFRTEQNTVTSLDWWGTVVNASTPGSTTRSPRSRRCGSRAPRRRWPWCPPTCRRGWTAGWWTWPPTGHGSAPSATCAR